MLNNIEINIQTNNLNLLQHERLFDILATLFNFGATLSANKIQVNNLADMRKHFVPVYVSFSMIGVFVLYIYLKLFNV